MPFSQSSIASVSVVPDGCDLLIDWSSSAPAGSVFQVYVDRRLAWSGTARRCHAPVPSGASGRNVWVDVGTVDPSETSIDFSTTLDSPETGVGAVALEWAGGTYLDPTGGDDLSGFRIYRSTAPGAAVDPGAPVADIPAYPGGWISDGFGLGGFGEGGFGRAAGSYAWTSPPLGPGLWRFRIVPYGRSLADRGPGQEVVAEVRVPPRPPARSGNEAPLTCEFSGPTSRRVTLRWRPSPSS